MNKLSTGDRRRTQVEEGQLVCVGGGELTRHRSFAKKPTRSWLHTKDKAMDLGFPTRFGAWVMGTATNASP